MVAEGGMEGGMGFLEEIGGGRVCPVCGVVVSEGVVGWFSAGFLVGLATAQTFDFGVRMRLPG
jgi:hypothetical protein